MDGDIVTIEVPEEPPIPEPNAPNISPPAPIDQQPVTEWEGE